MTRVLIVALLVLQWATAQAAGFDQSAWDTLLKAHVTPLRNGQATQVDYAGFAADRNQLRQYLANVSKVVPAELERWDRASQLAFLINAYNAFTVELIRRLCSADTLSGVVLRIAPKCQAALWRS